MYVVTGGAGFIGSNIVKALNDEGIQDILVVDDLHKGEHYRNLCDRQIADYMDRAEFRRYLQAHGLPPGTRGVSHQGACADTMELDGRYMLDNNFTFSKELLSACQAAEVPLVYASSASVYGASTTFREKPEYERPLNVYGYSKLLFDQHVRQRVSSSNSTIVGLRYFNVYGPREQHKGRMASMVYQLYRQLKLTGTARLFDGGDGYGPGEQRRDFVFVGDIVKVNLHFLRSEGDPTVGVFNCGSGYDRPFNDIARTLIDRLGSGRIEYFPMPESLHGKYQNFTKGDIAKLRAAGYGAPMATLEEGIDAALAQWESE